MTQWQQLEFLFHQVIDLPPEQREAFLRDNTNGDNALAAEVLALATGHDKLHPLLDGPRPFQLPAGTRIGPYKLQSILGGGGMGTVYSAFRADQQFEKQVAIKLVNAGLFEAVGGGRFELERQILASLDHPNIARLLDAGLNEFGQPYLVMERVDGLPLDQWVRTAQPNLDARLRLFAKIADAVGFAHRNLIIHRDLKPTNILVTADAIPKLLDFGIAKLLAEDRDATGTILFSPLFASPEQLRGKGASTSVDIYSLGVLLYLLAADTLPFPGLALHPAGERNLTFPGNVSKDLAAVVAKALHPEPERRYVSVDQFAEDVERFRTGLPVRARPDTFLYQAGKYVQRHRVGTAAAGLTIAALLAAAGMIVRQSRIAERERLKSDAVSAFLLDVIGNASPERSGALQGKPADLKLIDLLDASAERVGLQFQTTPDVEIRVRDQVASAYEGIQQFAKAAAQANQGLNKARRIFGDTSPQAAQAYYRLGRIAVAESHFQEGERLLHLALERWAKLGVDDVTLFAARESLAVALSSQGKPKEALELDIAVYEFDRKHFGENSSNAAAAANNIAYQYYSLNDRVKFRDWIERSVAVYRHIPEPPVAFGSTLNNLAQVAFQDKDYPKAIAAMEEAVSFWRKQYGTLPHVDVGTGLANSAIMRTTAGRTGATPLAEEAVVIYRKLFAPDSIEVAHGLYALGMSQCADGAMDAGVESLKSSLAIRRKSLPANDGRTASSTFQLGRCLTRMGRTQEAVPHLQSAVSMRREKYGPDDSVLRDMQAALDRAVQPVR